MNFVGYIFIPQSDPLQSYRLITAKTYAGFTTILAQWLNLYKLILVQNNPKKHDHHFSDHPIYADVILWHTYIYIYIFIYIYIYTYTSRMRV